MTKRSLCMTAVAAVAFTLSSVAAHAEKKPTVLLVHTAGQTDTDWKQLSLDLAGEGYRVLATKVPVGQSADEERAGLAQILSNEDPAKRLLVITSEPAGATVSNFATAQGDRVKGVVYLTATPSRATVSAIPQFYVQLTSGKTARPTTQAASYTVHAAGPQMTASTSDLVDVIEAVDAKKELVATRGNSRPTTTVAATTKVAAHAALSAK